jgi:hypothetical protein
VVATRLWAKDGLGDSVAPSFVTRRPSVNSGGSAEMAKHWIMKTSLGFTMGMGLGSRSQ